MSARRLIQLQLFFITVVALQCLIPHAAAADEESLERARTLRDRAQFDAALEVFRKLSGDMSIDKDVRAVATFETAETLVYKSRMQADPMSREGLLIDAQRLLTQFVSENGEHPLASAAAAQLANILVERAKILVAQSNTLAPAEQKEKAVAQARKLFGQALDTYRDSLATTRAKLERIGPRLDPIEDRELTEIRDQLRNHYLQARLLIPAIKEELADTYDDKSPRRRELLQSAADDFRDCYEDYRTRIVGLYGLLYKGRCHVKLGECDKALECFNELLDQPDSIEAFRDLKRRAALLAADCWLDEKRKDHRRAIDVLQNLIDKAKKDELRQQDWLWLRVKLARAYKLQADELSKIKERTEQQEQPRKESASKALEHAREAAKVPGEHAEQARAIIDEISGTPTDKSSAAERKIAEVAALEIKSFDEAFQTAREMIGLMNQPETRRDKALFQKTQREAIRLLQMALDSVDADTPIEDVNTARYVLAYVYFVSGEFAKAAEIGELVARRFSDHRAARPAAQIAVAAHLKEYQKAAGKPKRLLETRIASICRYILRTWPDDPITVDAAQTLTMVAIQNDRFDEAAANLELVPEAAPKRGTLEIQLGQSLWRASLSGSDEKKVELRTRAKRLLESGIRRPAWNGRVTDLASPEIAEELQPIGRPQVSQTVANGALVLCQIHVNVGEFAEAVALLEDKKIGPYTLVASNSPAATVSNYDLQTLIVATQAYRGIVEADGTDAETQKEAEGKLKEAIFELDRMRKARDKRDGGGVDIELTPIDE